jgi:hypothetical protein
LQVARLRKKKKKKLRLTKKDQQQISKPGAFHPVCATIVDNPGITYIIAQISSIRIRTSEQLSVLTARNRFFEKS